MNFFAGEPGDQTVLGNTAGRGFWRGKAYRGMGLYVEAWEDFSRAFRDPDLDIRAEAHVGFRPFSTSCANAAG